MSHSFQVEREQAGMRLDKFLVSKLQGESRAKIQRDIETGKWEVDGKTVTKHFALKEGQRVEEILRQASAFAHASAYSQSDKKNAGTNHGRAALRMIAETEDYLVVDKPAGIAVHGGPGVKGSSLSGLLMKKYPELQGVGEDPSRPGIVHRLDKDVSGVMIVARTQANFVHLKRQFQERKVEKEYTALVYGTFVNDEGRIELPLVRSNSAKKHGTMKALQYGQADVEGARDALTEFAVLRRFPRATLVAVHPRTGRMHQIRAHFAAIGHPIIGDPLYRSTKVLKVNIALERLFLHATKIAFTDRSGEEKAYNSPLPEDLRKALAQIT